MLYLTSIICHQFVIAFPQRIDLEGLGHNFITTLSESEKDRTIAYVALAYARYGSDPLIPVFVDEISLEFGFDNTPPTSITESTSTPTAPTTLTVNPSNTTVPINFTTTAHETSEVSTTSNVSTTEPWWSQGGTWMVVSVLITVGSAVVIVVFIVLIIRNRP